MSWIMTHKSCSIGQLEIFAAILFTLDFEWLESQHQ